MSRPASAERLQVAAGDRQVAPGRAGRGAAGSRRPRYARAAPRPCRSAQSADEIVGRGGRPRPASAAPTSRSAPPAAPGPAMASGALDLGVRRLEPPEHGGRSRVRSAVNSTGSRGRAAAPETLPSSSRVRARGSRPQRRRLPARATATGERPCGPQALEPFVSHPLGGEPRQPRRRGPRRPPRSRDRWRSRTGRRNGAPGGFGGSPRGTAARDRRPREPVRPPGRALPPNGSRHSCRSG